MFLRGLRISVTFCKNEYRAFCLKQGLRFLFVSLPTRHHAKQRQLKYWFVFGLDHPFLDLLPFPLMHTISCRICWNQVYELFGRKMASQKGCLRIWQRVVDVYCRNSILYCWASLFVLLWRIFNLFWKVLGCCGTPRAPNHLTCFHLKIKNSKSLYKKNQNTTECFSVSQQSCGCNTATHTHTQKDQQKNNYMSTVCLSFSALNMKIPNKTPEQNYKMQGQTPISRRINKMEKSIPFYVSIPLSTTVLAFWSHNLFGVVGG